MKVNPTFQQIRDLILEAKNNSFKAVNKELINLYWNIGKSIHLKIVESEWGKSIVSNLADYLKKTEPNSSGFSAQNLWRMKQFYETYANDKKLSPLVREITWSNNLAIISKTASNEEKEFYLKICIKENLTKRELERQIDSGLFERVLTTKTNLSPALREIHPKAENIFKEHYVLDFLDLSKNHSEKDLREGIIENLKQFILEFGKDFTYIGQEYRVQVGNKDFFIDLLFYHRDLQCMVAIDLKITDYKPEYLGKMEFYLEALDKDIKKNHEKPSVGIILCKNKDQKIVQYSLNRSLSPTLVAKYQTELIDKRLLEAKLDEFYKIAEDDKN